MAKKKNDLLNQSFWAFHKEIAYIVAERDFYRELSECLLLELAHEHWFKEDVDGSLEYFVNLAKLAVGHYTDKKYMDRLEVDFDIGTEQEGLL